MSWLENNPVGVVLASACGLLLLLSLWLGWAWSWPVSSGADDINNAGQAPEAMPRLDSELGQLSAYQVVNDRPVFDESRRPQIIVDEEEGPIELVGPEVADRPDVKLTGVVITPEAKIVMLTPNQKGEAVIVREGMPLEGEYVGWSVSGIGARKVTLKSTEGEALQIELAVHDAMIAEPPKPAPATDEGESEQGDAEPLSRADEIRKRIQERREQLRREAEQEEEDAVAEKAAQRNDYQDAIRAMMNRNKDNDNESTEDEE